MPDPQDRPHPNRGVIRILSDEDARALRKPLARAVLDEGGHTRLTTERAAALERVKRFRWWNASAEFPDAPDEKRQLDALVNWFEGFTLMSAMLLAPGMASGAVMLLVDRSAESARPLGISVAIISLFLLMLVMQRLAYPLWGRTGDPGLLVRRATVLMLAGPPLAALSTQVRPSPAVERAGLWILAVLIVSHGLLVLLFLYHYLRYTDCTNALHSLHNATPEEAVRSLYVLLRPGGKPAERQARLAEAAQYFSDFRTGRIAPAVEGEQVRRWMTANEFHPQTLAEMGWKLTALLDGLWVGDQEYDFEVADSVTLDGLGRREMIVCCALRSKGLAGLSEGAAVVEDLACRAHRLIEYDDGWFFDGLSSALKPEDIAMVRRIQGWVGAEAAAG